MRGYGALSALFLLVVACGTSVVEPPVTSTGGSSSTGLAGAGGAGGGGVGGGPTGPLCTGSEHWTKLGSTSAIVEWGHFPRFAWSGSRLFMWGDFNDAGDPGIPNNSFVGVNDSPGDAWSVLDASAAISPRIWPYVDYAGSRLVVWGGRMGDSGTPDGGLYDADAASWTAISAAGAPAGVSDGTMVSTGDRIIVWGGVNESYEEVASGAVLDVASNTWSPTWPTGAPAARKAHVAVWTGSRMIVWGGGTPDGALFGDGAAYDPVGDNWTPISSAGAPEPRVLAGAVWTGTRMMVWGGQNKGTWPQQGGLYDPATDAWTPTSTAGAPLGFEVPLLVPVAGRVLLLSGYYPPGGAYPGVAVLYDPATDTWQDATPAGSPFASGVSHAYAAFPLDCGVVVWGRFGAGGGAQGWFYEPPP